VEYLQLIKKRRSIRKYKPDPVSDKDIETILEAARLAPSWSNLQCWHYITVTDQSIKEKLAGEKRKWLSDAPVIIVACADPNESGQKPGMDYFMLDIGISFEHLILAATDLGLGTCWIGAFNEKKAKEALGIPEEIRVVAMTPLGYPDEKKDSVYARKSLREIVFNNRYGQAAKIPGIQSTVAGTIKKLYIKGRKLKEKLRNKFAF
jgi:nitroreductase